MGVKRLVRRSAATPCGVKDKLGNRARCQPEDYAGSRSRPRLLSTHTRVRFSNGESNCCNFRRAGTYLQTVRIPPSVLRERRPNCGIHCDMGPFQPLSDQIGLEASRA